MTSTAVRLSRSHPLDPVTDTEIAAVRRILDAADLVSDQTRFVYVGLAEPAKADVLAHRPGDAVAR
ncbi:MAG TPA: hypothetical protein VEZ42_04645, partial [Pseudonocardia sp.]|nr:hypothetical protein [Pseudonocardia sp.]